MGAMDVLRADHVNEAQGYLFSRPLDPESFENRLLDPVRSTYKSPPNGG